MLPEIGLFLLVAALLSGLMQAMAGMLAPSSSAPAAALVRSASLAQWLCLSFALLILILARMTSDFSVAIVAANSQRALPLLYKITGAWGNHEGSMLLWGWILAGWGMLLARQRHADAALRLRAAGVQGGLGTAFLLFLLLTSNPFARVFPPPPDGTDLNPLLQDIGLAMHPPLLYLGYVGFSSVFSLAVAAMLLGRMEQSWARTARPWILASWSCLTLGIGLGGWWAYRELGWGGWWFWDPVENVSLMPWLAGTALLHANAVLEKRGQLQLWVLVLAILAFSMSLLGTFLVRSGVVTSVHSFASDPDRGIFILGMLVAITGGAFALFAVRAPLLASKSIARPLSREGLIVVNNVLLVAACASVLLGTVYPLAVEWLSGERLSVGPPYFSRTFLPLMGLAAAVAAVAPLVAWKRADAGRMARSLRFLILPAIIVFALVAFIADRSAWPAAAGMALAAWIMAGTVTAALRQRRLRMRQYGMVFGHAGVALLVAAITGSSLWKTESVATLAPGETLQAGSWTIRLDKTLAAEGPNYTAEQSTFTLLQDGKQRATLTPEIRTYPVNGMQTTESAIVATWCCDIVAATGRWEANGTVPVRIYVTPLMHMLWAGFLLTTAGGMLSWLSTRRETRQKDTEREYSDLRIPAAVAGGMARHSPRPAAH